MSHSRDAVELLNNRFFLEIGEFIKRDLYDEWLSSTDFDKREHLHKLALAVDLIHSQITAKALETRNESESS